MSKSTKPIAEANAAPERTHFPVAGGLYVDDGNKVELVEAPATEPVSEAAAPEPTSEEVTDASR